MPPKRKRPERPPGDSGRSSPHQPAESTFAQHDREDGGGRGFTRGRGYYRGRYHRRDSSFGHDRRDFNNNQALPPNTHGQHSHSALTPSRVASFSAHARPPSPAQARPQVPPSPPVTMRQTAPSPASASRHPASPASRQPVEPAKSGYIYDNLTDDVVNAWADHGRSGIIKHGIQSREDVDITELSSLFQEFIHAVVNARIEATDAGACVKEILGDQTSDVIKDSYAFAPHTLFLDTLAIIMDNNMGLYRPALRDFLIATGVSPALMREILDVPLLQQLGLIRDTFARLGVRQATNLLYRQANYNLLREESEGYSKLITELFSTNTIPPPSPGKTFEKVKGLIGTFDLDVGRALDVTLDVSAAILIKHYKFFVKFLRISSWWPSSRLRDDSPFVGGLPTWAEPDYPNWSTSAEDEEKNSRLRRERDTAFWKRAREVHLAAFFELGGRRVTDKHLERAKTNGQDSENAAASAERMWIEKTKTLPAPGNRVAAQLLGFKLRFYNSEMRDQTDVLPANLLYLAALLIKIGFLSLTDLYPHLSPDDGDMEKVREAEAEKIAREERAARGGGQMNALLMAGVLPQGDDDNPMLSVAARRDPVKKVEAEQKKPGADEAGDKNRLPEPLEQKVSLLIQLLTIGALPESLFMIGRFPWVTEMFPEVLQRLHRILHVCIDQVYNGSRPSHAAPAEFATKSMPDIDQAGMPKGSVRLQRLPVKKIWRWPFPDKHDTNDNQSYRFYWDEWVDNIPVCQTVDDVFTLCNTLLNISGVNIGKDEALLSKLATIGAMSLADDQSESNRARWQDLARRLLLPALSHTKANASVVNAVWDIVKQYPLVVRYAMYAEWYEGQMSRLPAMKSAFAKSAAETRATMKRVSLTNLSEMAKRLAKTSYSSPGIVFKVAFEQLEVYSNLIEAFVECAKYFTDLSYDVLVWSLMNSLGKSRNRTQEEHALTTSKWLQALSRFSGKVFRRYSVLSPVPVLKYVEEQLFHDNSTDLIILKEFLSSMGGIVDAVDFTDSQITAMAGGFSLRRQTLIRAQDKRFENIKSSARLMQALSDSRLGTRLLINLAQFRQGATYRVPEEEAHIKYLSSLIDDSQQTLAQFIDFLWSNLDAAGYDAVVPSIPELIRSYGLSVDIAFLLGRASLGHQMFPWKDVKAKREAAEASKALVDKEGDVSMCDAKAQNGEPTPTEVSAAGDQQVGPLSTTPAQVSGANPTRPQKTDDTSLSHTVLTALQPVCEAVRGTAGPEVWDKMSPELYSIFWALQLGDLCFPEKAYVDERNRLMAELQAVSIDRSDMTRRGLDRKAEKKKHLMDTADDMIAELSDHGLRRAKWKFYLTKLFQTSFPNRGTRPEIIADVLLEHCFLPRMLLSPADAEYTYRFVKALHEYNAPVFRLMVFLERLFNANRLRTLIFACTVREAENFGRFLNMVLEDLSRWHTNAPSDDGKKQAKDTARLGPYDREVKGTADQPRLGFALTFTEQGKPETFVEHAQFRDMLFRWHKNLNMALKSCLGGSEWMHIRNAITVLKAVLNHFPAVDFMASQFTAQLQKITKREAAAKELPEGEEGGRVDLSVAAQGAMSQLQQKKSKWMMVQAFRSNAVSIERSRGPMQADAAPKAAAAGPQPEADRTAAATKLRATAPDFKPTAKYGRPKRSHRRRRNFRADYFYSRPGLKMTAMMDQEDGEVQDARESGGPSGTGTPRDAMLAKFAGAERGELGARKDEASMPSRSSTPRPGLPNQAKADVRAHKLPERPTAHNLPTRPDVPIPTHLPSERFAQPGRAPERRDTRDVREVREARDWPLDQDRLRTREHVDRRVGDVTGEARHDLPPRPGMHERERLHREPRSGRMPDRHAEAGQALQGLAAAGTAAELSMNPDRAALFVQDGADRNTRRPEADRLLRGRSQAGELAEAAQAPRAALAEDRSDVAPQMAAGRLARDELRDRGGPRPPSPRRHMGGGWHDERQSRPFPPDPRGPPPGRDPRDRSPMAGDGFRSERPAEREAMEPMRDASGFPRSGPRGPDVDQRLPHQDQNYGRLNAMPSTSDIPLGPRGRGARPSTTRGGGHGGPSTPGWADGRLGGPETPRAPSPDRVPPTGPASGRGRRGGYDHGSTLSGLMGGPLMDRARSFGAAGDAQVGASGDGTATLAGLASERVSHMGASLPPPPLTGLAGLPPGHGQSRHANGGERSVSGPARAVAGPSSGEPGVPTGPASSGERLRYVGGRRQLAGINNTLQQAQGGADMTRASGPRPARQYLGNSDAQVLTGGPAAATAGQERGDMAWQDSGSRGQDSGSRGQSNGGGEGLGRRDYRVDREGRTDRTSRPSRRSSRERERSDRSPRAMREGEGREHREYRDRRLMMGGAEGGGREAMGAPLAGSREAAMGGGREGGHRVADARGGEEWGGAAGGDGGGGYGGRGAGSWAMEERRDMRDDRGRKRRSEEGAGSLASDRDKRPRRGP